MPLFNKRLRSILTKNGLLSEEEANKAAEIAEKSKNSLSQVVLERGLVQERDLVCAVAIEMDIPPVDLSKAEPDDDALECLPQDMANYYCVLPVAKIGDVLTLALANPFDILKIDDVQLVTGCEIRPVVSTDIAIRKAIQRFYSPGEQEMSDLIESAADYDMDLAKAEEDEEEFDLSELGEVGKGSPVVKLVNLVIYQAIKNDISDIHIEPFEKSIRVRYRQDGILFETISPPKKMQNAIVSRIKIMSNLDIAEKRRPQDGKFQLKIDGKQIDFRVSVLPVVHGEKVVMRILDSGNLALHLDQLGFEQKSLNDFSAAIKAPYGMILVTGPTGSGKSTTLYSAIREVMSITQNIVTVEDPVEYQIEGINQVPVSIKRGLTFASALRSILRQDPDIIMIGEVRDLETAEIAVKAALTGHLVLSTLHTNDAPSTITRLIDMGIDPFMVASSVILVSAQRLCRRLCNDCKEPYNPPNKDRLIEVGFLPEETKNVKIFNSKGCPRCNEGYKGRFALLETLPMTQEIKRLVLDGGSALDIKKLGLEQGMLTLRRCGILNVLKGNASIEEVLRVTMSD